MLIPDGDSGFNQRKLPVKNSALVELTWNISFQHRVIRFSRPTVQLLCGDPVTSNTDVARIFAHCLLSILNLFHNIFSLMLLHISLQVPLLNLALVLSLTAKA